MFNVWVWQILLSIVFAHVVYFWGFPGSSAGKESSCNADRLPPPVFLGFSDGSDGKESTCNAGFLGSIPGLGRSPGGGRGNLL